MKLSINWLRDYVDLPVDDANEIADTLARLGFEVEEVQVFEAPFRGVVVGKVLDVRPHPDADRIRVCDVDVGAEVLEIVCGAWNFEAGATVPVAVPGAVLGEDFEITRRKIRGVVSNGMICSEQELGLGDDHDGIMVLDATMPDTAERLGQDFAALLGYPDVVLDLSITPNRPDAMSVVGLARELAAAYEVELRPPVVDVSPQPPPTTVTVQIEDPDGCPRFVAREVRDLTVGPSPLWMRRRLLAAGVRPINNVVDASNYVMMELGHPTHAFDADHLGDVIVVRRAKPGEHIVTLDDVDRTLDPTDMVVADAERPVAIAGVMGGADTEVSDTTTRVVIEAAYWDPPSVLLTSKRLGLRSEASARFERGVDPNACDVAADRVAQLLADHAGGTVVEGLVDEYPKRIDPWEVTLPVEELDRVLGVAIPEGRAADILTRLGFEVRRGNPLHVTVPTRRPDITRPVDLVEEVARLEGYDSFPSTLETGRGGGLPVDEKRRRKARKVMAGAGYLEAITFSFVAPGDVDIFDFPDRRNDPIRLTNPLHDDFSVLRTSLLPGLLRAVARNFARQLDDITLFEMGKIFLRGTDEIPDQPDVLAFVAAGTRRGGWLDADRPFDVYDATGVVATLFDTMRIDAQIRQATPPGFHPGRAADIVVADVVIGAVGEIHPAVMRHFGLPGRAVAAELDLTQLLAPQGGWQFRAPSAYPPVIFDLAFVVPEDVPAARLLDAIDAAAGPELERREVFDVYVGGSLPPGTKSIAVRLTFRADDRTLTDEEVAPIRRRIVEAVERATGGRLRGEA